MDHADLQPVHFNEVSPTQSNLSSHAPNKTASRCGCYVLHGSCAITAIVFAGLLIAVLMQLLGNPKRLLVGSGTLTALVVFAWIGLLLLTMQLWHWNLSAGSGWATRRSCCMACMGWSCTIGIVIGLWFCFFILMAHYWAGFTRYPFDLACQKSPPVTDPEKAIFVWAGAVTESSVTFRFSIGLLPCTVLPLGVDQEECNANPKEVKLMEVPYVQSWTATNLSACTKYHYKFTRKATGQVVSGTVRTFPDNSPACHASTVQILTSSCAATGSDSPVWDDMYAQDADLFIHLGDLHYDDLGVEATITDRVTSYLRVLDPCQYCDPASKARQPSFYRSLALAYIWDDHDFLGDNSEGTDASGTLLPAALDALKAYQSFVPHYPLKVPGTLYQSFDIGNLARVIITDLRTQRQSEGNNTHMMDVDQVTQFFTDLDNQTGPCLVIWVSPSPWLYSKGYDTWGKHQDYGAFLNRLNVSFYTMIDQGRNLFMVSGDMHSTAWDDGTNTALGIPGFPLLQASPLDKRAAQESCKGGPYLESDFCSYVNEARDCAQGRYGLIDLQPSSYSFSVHAQNGNANCYAHATTHSEASAGPYYGTPQSFACGKAFWKPVGSPRSSRQEKAYHKWTARPFATPWGWVAILLAIAAAATFELISWVVVICCCGKRAHHGQQLEMEPHI